MIETFAPNTNVYLLGTFTYVLNGETKTEDFSIKAPAFTDDSSASESDEGKEQAVAIYNLKLAECFDSLRILGATQIHYHEISPCILF